jgi:hypothetical protein
MFATFVIASNGLQVAILKSSICRIQERDDPLTTDIHYCVSNQVWLSVTVQSTFKEVVNIIAGNK